MPTAVLAAVGSAYRLLLAIEIVLSKALPMPLQASHQVLSAYRYWLAMPLAVVCVLPVSMQDQPPHQ